MKKVLFILMAMVTALAMSSCDPNGFTGGFGGGGGKPDKNYYCIDSTYQDIKSCVSYTEENETYLMFSCDNLSVIEFTFEDRYDIPAGTFTLDESEECNIEGNFESIDLSGDLVGALTISLTDSICTITFEGNIVDDTISTPFSMDYQDVITNANEDTGLGALTIDSTAHVLKRGICTNQSYEGLNLLALVLTNGNESELEDYCVATLSFLGKTDIPVGTFAIAEMPFAGALLVVEADEMEHTGMTGEITISKDGDNYKVTANGSFKPEEEGSDAVEFSRTYEGRFVKI